MTTPKHELERTTSPPHDSPVSSIEQLPTEVRAFFEDQKQRNIDQREVAIKLLGSPSIYFEASLDKGTGAYVLAEEARDKTGKLNKLEIARIKVDPNAVSTEQRDFTPTGEGFIVTKTDITKTVIDGDTSKTRTTEVVLKSQIVTDPFTKETFLPQSEKTQEIQNGKTKSETTASFEYSAQGLLIGKNEVKTTSTPVEKDVREFKRIVPEQDLQIVDETKTFADSQPGKPHIENDHYTYKTDPEGTRIINTTLERQAQKDGSRTISKFTRGPNGGTWTQEQ
jgi:hypothetical protein